MGLRVSVERDESYNQLPRVSRALTLTVLRAPGK